MIIKFKSNRYLQLLSLFSWFFLSSVLLFNNINAGQDNWLQLCTQQGIKLVNVAVQSDAAKHPTDPCECTFDSFVAQHSLDIAAPLVALQLISHYHFTYAALAYQPPSTSSVT